MNKEYGILYIHALKYAVIKTDSHSRTQCQLKRFMVNEPP